jgi:hypothetical protein
VATTPLAFRRFASGLLGLALAACGAQKSERLGLSSDTLAGGAEAPAPANAEIVLERVASSVWGVAPEAPSRGRTSGRG